MQGSCLSLCLSSVVRCGNKYEEIIFFIKSYLFKSAFGRKNNSCRIRIVVFQLFYTRMTFSVTLASR